MYPCKSSMTTIALLVSCALSQSALADTSVIHAGELLVIAGKAPLKKQTLVITDGKISALKAGFIAPSSFAKDAKLVDLSSSFVMSGLMDMHVHLQGELGPNNDSDTVNLSDADVLMKSAYFANKTLLAGFTTVRDLGSSAEQMFALRDGVKRGWITGPTIIASGSSVAVTGGHGDVDGMAPNLMTLPGTGQQMADDEIKEVIDTAHALGRKVASHAHAAAGINAALRAGVDSIEHGSYANAESIKLFKKYGAYLVPTLMAGDTVVTMAKTTNFMSPAIRAKAIRVGGDMTENFKRSYKAGVKIAYGTDSGVSKHGYNAREAQLMFAAGMTAQDILVSATINGADLIDKTDSLGTLEIGKVADVIAMHASPLNDINELMDVDFVMKSGKIVKQK